MLTTYRSERGSEILGTEVMTEWSQWYTWLEPFGRALEECHIRIKANKWDTSFSLAYMSSLMNSLFRIALPIDNLNLNFLVFQIFSSSNVLYVNIVNVTDQAGWQSIDCGNKFHASLGK